MLKVSGHHSTFFLLFVGLISLATSAARSQQIVEYSIPFANAEPTDIAVAQNGDLWVTLYNPNAIARITTAGDVKVFPVPPVDPIAATKSIVLGPDGNMWFSNAGFQRIGRITPSGEITLFKVPFQQRELTVGPDGALWFAASQGKGLLRVTTSGEVSSVTASIDYPSPEAIALGSDGNLWLASESNSSIGRLTTRGELSLFKTPTPTSGPRRITPGSVGSLWFTESTIGKIGVISVDGEIKEISLPDPGSSPNDIVQGSDGNMWVTLSTSGKIARISKYGAVTELSFPTPNANPQGIAAGKDGNLWVALRSANKIAKIIPQLPGTQIGGVYSAQQSAFQSLFRFINTGLLDGSVQLTLADSKTGQPIWRWTSTNIPAGTAVQYAMAQIESEAKALPGSPHTKPQQYSVSIDAQLSGYVQHVLWKPSDGTLTNASTCSQGVTAKNRLLNSVHSTILDNGYPSTITVHNTGSATARALLEIYDARNNIRLGNYETISILPNADLALRISDIEAATHIKPTSEMFHYIVKVGNNFEGFLQHTVTNEKVGITTDMSSVCAFSATDVTAVKNFKILAQPTNVIAINTAQNGNVWYVTGNDSVGKLSPDGTIAIYTKSNVRGISWFIGFDEDQNPWVAGSSWAFRLSQAGQFETFGSYSDQNVFQRGVIVPGDQGSIWVSTRSNTVQKISPKTGIQSFSEYSRDAPASIYSWVPDAIASDGQGGILYRVLSRSLLGRISSTGVIKEFPVAALSFDDADSGVSLGPDGNIWFTAGARQQVGRISQTGELLSPLWNVGANPGRLKTGSDGNLWFVAGAKKIGRITTSGDLSEYILPPGGGPPDIFSDADGDIWYNQTFPAAKIVRLTTSVQIPGVYSSQNTNIQSFLRFANAGAGPGSVKVFLNDPTTGKVIVDWTSPAIAAGAAAQYSITEIEASATSSVPKPDRYSVKIQGRMNGFVQHVLWRPKDGTLTNASTCNAGVVSTGLRATNVHSSLLSANYPSSIMIFNTGRAEIAATVGVYDAKTGQRFGTFTTAPISSSGSLNLQADDI